jgi:hypothetical protein
MKFSFCHCEEGAEARDAAIHRVSEDADGLAVRLLRTSGSPRAYALAMTNMGDMERSEAYISLFTHQTSPLPSLAFLEGYAEGQHCATPWG